MSCSGFSLIDRFGKISFRLKCNDSFDLFLLCIKMRLNGVVDQKGNGVVDQKGKRLELDGYG